MATHVPDYRRLALAARNILSDEPDTDHSAIQSVTK